MREYVSLTDWVTWKSSGVGMIANEKGARDGRRKVGSCGYGALLLSPREASATTLLRNNELYCTSSSLSV